MGSGLNGRFLPTYRWLGVQILVMLITIPLVAGDFGSLYSRVQALFGTVQGNVTQLIDKGCSANGAGPSFGGFGAPHRSSQLRYAAASYTKVKITRGEVPAKPFLDACTDFLPLIGQLPPLLIAPNPDVDAAEWSLRARFRAHTRLSRAAVSSTCSNLPCLPLGSTSREMKMPQ